MTVKTKQGNDGHPVVLYLSEAKMMLLHMCIVDCFTKLQLCSGLKKIKTFLVFVQILENKSLNN